MKKGARPLVIAIAAVSGGGKTTIAHRLAAILKPSKGLFFDDYQFDGAPENIVEWIENRGNYNEWDLTPLINDVRLLSEQVPRLEYILLDYPFAYLHGQMSRYIDWAVFIDTPLDMAMARRVLRDFSEGSLESVRDDLVNYLSRGRLAYLDMLERVKPNSDLIVDGSLPLDVIVRVILKELEGRV